MIIGPGFNRYMVECEFIGFYSLVSEKKVLIDTWWNVNHIDQAAVSNGHTVLIDTWWNVNVDYDGLVLRVEQVLIDTWWNVNEG